MKIIMLLALVLGSLGSVSVASADAASGTDDALDLVLHTTRLQPIYKFSVDRQFRLDSGNQLQSDKISQRLENYSLQIENYTQRFNRNDDYLAVTYEVDCAALE